MEWLKTIRRSALFFLAKFVMKAIHRKSILKFMPEEHSLKK